MKTINKSVSTVFFIQLIKRMNGKVEENKTQTNTYAAEWTVACALRTRAQGKQNDCYSHWKLLSILSTPLNCHFVLLFAFVHSVLFLLPLFSVPPFGVLYIFFLNWLNTPWVRERALDGCASLHFSPDNDGAYLYYLSFEIRCRIHDWRSF